MTDPGEAFVQSCERFIHLCDDDPAPEPQRLWKLRGALADLVVRLTDLPAAGDELGEVREEPTRKEVFDRLSARFPSLGEYVHCHEPLQIDDPEVHGMHGIDNMTDTYRALSVGLDLWRDGQRHEAIGHWLSTYYYDWGDDVSSCQRLLHTLFRRDYVKNPP